MFGGFKYKIDKVYLDRILEYNYFDTYNYNDGDTISFSCKGKCFYIIIDGNVDICMKSDLSLKLFSLDSQSIISNFSLFSKDVIFISNGASKVIGINYDRLLDNCNDISFYRYIINIMDLLLEFNFNISKRLLIISNKSTESKLISYFRTNSVNNCCTLKSSYTDLADYLCVDRSSMMRTLSNMEKNGIIKRRGRRIVINYKK